MQLKCLMPTVSALHHFTSFFTAKLLCMNLLCLVVELCTPLLLPPVSHCGQLVFRRVCLKCLPVLSTQPLPAPPPTPSSLFPPSPPPRPAQPPSPASHHRAERLMVKTKGSVMGNRCLGRTGCSDGPRPAPLSCAWEPGFKRTLFNLPVWGGQETGAQGKPLHSAIPSPAGRGPGPERTALSAPPKGILSLCNVQAAPADPSQRDLQPRGGLGFLSVQGFLIPFSASGIRHPAAAGKPAPPRPATSWNG